MKKAIAAAVRNVAAHGDTDIFPFPFEGHMFHDVPDDCVRILAGIHADFDGSMALYPPETIVTLSQVGYTGFRWATQIEPFWNAYYLGLVIQAAPAIEQARIPEGARAVFSYRLDQDKETGRLFGDSTWREYRERSLELAARSPFVVVTDIADFYPRIGHHRIENALRRILGPDDSVRRIMALLALFSGGASCGLPVGGPASRILAELALADVDSHLRVKHQVFCRYVDDIALFCKSKSDAYKAIVFLSEKLFNEGLVLSRKKTRILTAGEYIEASRAFDSPDGAAEATDEQKLLDISIRYDPYSPTADEDYERVKEAVGQVDIVGILCREVAKVAIDPTISKLAIGAIRALEPEMQAEAIRTILAAENLDVLSPVFVPILRLVRTLYNDLDAPVQDDIDEALLELYRDGSPLLSVDLNLSYFVQCLGQRQQSDKEELLIDLFERSSSPLVRRLIILVLGDWQLHFWLSDLKRKAASLGTWERRAFILASYALGDEGKHWRDHAHKSWSPPDSAVRDWFAKRHATNARMPI